MDNKSSIDTWLTASIRQLTEAGINSARLDAELVLAHTLRKPRTWIHAHGDELLEPRYRDIADARIDLRLDRIPIAYIIGHKDFYGRRFDVTTATLIPRPESETMIELLGELISEAPARLVDVGTGSGCLGITAKLENPQLDVSLVDVDKHALTVAQKNATRLNARVDIIRSDLLASYPYQPNIILANLPYVDPEWERFPEVNHEPAIALFAEDSGLKLIKQLIDQARSKLSTDGLVFIEADRRQHHIITAYAKDRGFAPVNSRGLILVYRLAPSV